ncbi:transporter substrate-binding domain-containing protein [Gilvimarinus sp. SDUM040013]|uniref:Transporter substrate-binding domain-containing protein n=1 Tax=Gilvimarinus gilvus TaxID=3058038 RepID=A0ABU4S2Z3_9GAMM|nr:transporter substrate-binding domain-containing protein [Gilvimarinus sp. SDUM040013]MDO3385179.1 transporter substrate-binding domain-containing protein [Gilvimarinus sp. SDUM040013]MDX6851549.1 transporter substrate-binding domain-containing protein [Gilvimarinus sp. SDUM040013]
MGKNNIRWIARQGLYLTFALFFPYQAFPDTLEVRYWGGTPGRVEYELEVLREALDAASDAPYTVQHNVQSYGSDRGRQEIALGDRVNVYASAYQHDALVTTGQLIPVERPLLKGLLGYRSLIVRKQDLAKFAAMTRLSDLQQVVVGQGSGWFDAQVYRHNGIEVDESARFRLLLGMLSHKRFDTVILGVMEAAPTLAGSQYADELSVVPGLGVYYPHPLIYYVSANAPQLAERLQRGMDLLQANGKLDMLFAQHYGDLIETMRASWQHLIILEHPNTPLEGALDAPVFKPYIRPPSFQ